MIILQDSPDPTQREWAAQLLAVVDWSGHDDVLPALLTAAAKDPTATVRVQCIRALAKRKLHSPQVIQAFQQLQTDIDARVQHEAVEALSQLGQ
jgi:hypothetical protein